MIYSFCSLPTLDGLTELKASNCPISTFEGASLQPSLSVLSCQNTPIASEPYFALMVFIAFGENVSKINVSDVSEYNK